MRTTLDIPDPLYRQIKVRAATEGRTIRELILEGIQAKLAEEQIAPAKPFKIPVIHSKRPGTLHLTNEEIDELTAFT